MDNGWASPVSRADTSWKRSNFTHASKNAGESLSAERLDGMLPTRLPPGGRVFRLTRLHEGLQLARIHLKSVREQTRANGSVRRLSDKVHVTSLH
jgi:hypothetical protein